MKIGAFGEVMLRLSPPEHLLLEQTDSLHIFFTGTGVNILGNLAHFGKETFMMSALPETRIGDAALSSLKKLGIKTDFIHQKGCHLGSYFAEIGYGARPTVVTYQNRLDSSFGTANAEEYPVEEFVQTVDLVHICGISLSLTDKTYETAILLAKKAQAQKKKVCFDFNFRPSLNTEANKKALMKKRYAEILPYCDIVFGNIRDISEEIPQTQEKQDEIIQSFMAKYGIEYFISTKRTFENQQQFLSSCLYHEDKIFHSSSQALTVLDRIGGGDAFAAGVLLGYIEQWQPGKTLEFALTNAVLAHTIQGDVPLTSQAQIEQVMKNPQIDILR